MKPGAISWERRPLCLPMSAVRPPKRAGPTQVPPPPFPILSLRVLSFTSAFYLSSAIIIIRRRFIHWAGSFRDRPLCGSVLCLSGPLFGAWPSLECDLPCLGGGDLVHRLWPLRPVAAWEFEFPPEEMRRWGHPSQAAADRKKRRMTLVIVPQLRVPSLLNHNSKISLKLVNDSRAAVHDREVTFP